MGNTKRPQVSLLTLFFLVTIAALLLSGFVMMRALRRARSEVDQARSEVEETRRHFGFLRIEDPKLIYVSRIEGEHRGGNWLNSYRLYIPPGHRLLLHVAETEITDLGEYETPQPAKTLSMNSWREGADVILNWDVEYDDTGIPHLKVATTSDQLFDYPIKAWKLGAGMHDGSHLSTGPQKAFLPDEEIRFMWSRDVATKRGVVFWMEPASRRYGKR
jgi:hypothetical protein